MRSDSASENPTKLSSITKAAGFSRVYWIDDQFGEAGPHVVAKVLAKISAITQMDESPKSTAIANLKLSGIATDDSQKISALLGSKKGLGHVLLRELEEQIEELSPSPVEDRVPADLTGDQVTLIASAFPEIRRMSLKEWKDDCAAILASVDETVLFLIDHDFSLEDGGAKTSGEDILRSIVSNDSLKCCCVLFTHGISIGNEHIQNRKVAQDIGAIERRHRFSVVCKEHITLPESKGEAPLARAFQDAFIRDWCHTIVCMTQTIFQNAFEATKNDLLDLSFDEISSAFFHRSSKDGTSEFDVLIRVMMLAGRVALEDEQPKKSALLQKLSKIRTLMGVAETAPQRPPDLQGHLASLREREIWDPGVVINSINSPLACGDVFEHKINPSKTRYYVLIGQPCHLAIRSDGSRKNNEALFLEISKDEIDIGRGYSFEFPKLGIQWISFDLVYPVNLYLLDFVSFNSEGSLLVSKEDSASPLLLPGLRKRFDKVVGFLKSHKASQEVKYRYRRLTICEDIDKQNTSIKEGKIQLPFVRIGRIRSPHSEAILGGFSVYHTRMAFDYDFSKQPDKRPTKIAATEKAPLISATPV